MERDGSSGGRGKRRRRKDPYLTIFGYCTNKTRKGEVISKRKRECMGDERAREFNKIAHIYLRKRGSDEFSPSTSFAEFYASRKADDVFEWQIHFEWRTGRRRRK